MSIAKIYGNSLNGTVSIPSSKSDAHRALICSMLSRGICHIYNVDLSDDIMATINAIRATGAIVNINQNHLIVDSSNTFTKNNIDIDCNESGSTLRFMIPVIAANGIDAIFYGKGNLPYRPINIYTNCLSKSGILCESNSRLPLKIFGKLKPSTFEVPGNISSQFISGLLFALPILNGDSEIKLSSPLQSRGYVDMTINTLKRFGVFVQETNNGWKIKGNQKYKTTSYNVEGDWSQAAFFLSSAAINGEITVSGLNFNSKQGDRIIVEILKKFGAEVNCYNDKCTVKSKNLYGIDIQACHIPDLIPILSVVAAFCNGITTIRSVGRLKIKESNRLQAIIDGLRNIGCNVEHTNDSLIIKGSNQLHASKINGYNDHRIVMAMSIMASHLSGTSYITNANSINKSFPDFFDKLKFLGGTFNIIKDK